jgi:multiple sugar transport system substrate-binding protein
MKLSSLAGATAILAACSPAAAPAGGGAAEGQEAAAPAGATVQLQYQSREPENAAGIAQLWNEWYPQFQAANPNIEVEFLPDPGGNELEVAMTSMVAGTAADVLEFCCLNSTYFIQQDQSLDLQPLIDRDAAEVNIDDYYAHQFDPWMRDGNIHMLPRFTGTMAVYINLDWFERAGVEPPAPEWGSWNYEQYAEIGAQFASDDPQTWGTSNYGLSGGAAWLAQYWLRGFGTNMVNPEDNTLCQVDAPEAQECLEYLRALTWDSKVYVPGSSAMAGGVGPDALFISERIAMMEMGPWNLSVILDGAQFRWDVVPMPDGPAGHTTHQSVDGSMIWKNTEHPEEAWTLLKGLTSPEYGVLYAKYGNKQPSRKSILAEFPRLLREFDERYNEVQLEVFIDSLAQDIGGPEEMFAKDVATKNQILQPAFDAVYLEGVQGVEYIAGHAAVATSYNRGEISDENLGAELEKVRT